MSSRARRDRSAGQSGGAVRLLYSCLWYPALPFVFARMLWRARRNRGYLHAWRERLGWAPVASGQSPLWVHAVSVGETVAAAPLVEALLTRWPETPVLVTSTTPTGAERVRALFGDRVQRSFIPFDTPDAVARFLERTHPRIGIIMETEIWPNLFAACRRRNIPLVLANARLSERSARGYRRAGRIISDSLDAIACIAAQGEVDAERFRSLGVAADRVNAVGNLKYEIEVPASVREKLPALRAQIGDGAVWLAASTHEGEEAIVLDAFERVRRHQAGVRLLLVPRHPERFNAVDRLCRERGYRTSRRSHGWPDASAAEVLLGDSMGELMLFYGIADVAFVGGSLVPVGGHNILEAVVYGCPVIIGPYTFNMDAMREAFAEATIGVEDAESLAGAVVRLLEDAEERGRITQRGQSLLAGHRGSLEQLVDLIEHVLAKAAA